MRESRIFWGTLATLLYVWSGEQKTVTPLIQDKIVVQLRNTNDCVQSFIVNWLQYYGDDMYKKVLKK